MALFPTYDEPKKVKKTFDPLAIDCPPTDNALTARIAMIGEAPSTVEIREKEPFVGPAGSQLNRICAAAKLPRHQIYLTNVCKTQLPKNNSDKLWTYKGYRHPDWSKLQARLIDELAQVRSRFIVPLGVTAMRMILDDPKFNAITKYAGSIYRAEDFPHLAEKLKGKFICLTFHPASTLPNAQPKNLFVMIAHLRKFLALENDPTLLDTKVTIHTAPTKLEVLNFYKKVQEHSVVGFDIEATPRFTTCFSLAIKYSDKLIETMSIPLMNNKGNYWQPEDEVDILLGLAEILNNPKIGKVAQNGMFDFMYQLRTMKMLTNNFAFDTMIAQHICYTDLPKGLDALTAFYTYFPYYKDEGKQSHLSAIKDWEMYWQYNAKDAAYLLPIHEKLSEELKDFEAEDAMEYSMDLHKPLMEMEFNGILTNQAEIKKVRAKYQRYIAAMQKGLWRLSGKELNHNSPKQMVNYFYYDLGIKPYINRKTKRPTCDGVALARIAKTKRKGAAEARLIMKIRYYHKLLSTYFNINVDADDKLRCNHKITGTVSGRIATEATYFGTGANLQNQPYVYKKYLIPEPGNLICECDLAKAEAHVVAYLCQDANMIHAFESGIDVHSFNASKIFGASIEEISAEQKVPGKMRLRDMGKRVVHASNYNMGPQTFSDQLAKEMKFYSTTECKQMLEAYKARFPNLTRWQKQIEETVKRDRVLFNLFGRPKRFLGMLNSALYRNAISYIPQSTVAELLNRGSIKVANDPRLGQFGFDIDLLTTVHDSIIFQFDAVLAKKNLLDILLIIKDHMSHTFTHLGRSFTIGLDAKIGWAWAGRTAELSSFTEENVSKALHQLGV